MYELNDDFNGGVISRHRTMEAAARAMHRHNRAVKRNNGQNSYIPYSLTENGKPLDESQADDWLEAEYRESCRG